MVQNFICLVVPSQCFSKCGKRPAALESCSVEVVEKSGQYVYESMYMLAVIHNM